MKLDVEVGGRTRDVTVERSPDATTRYRVTVDGRVHDIDCRETAAGRYSLVHVGQDAWSHEVAITSGERPGELRVRVRHGTFRVVVDGARDGRRLEGGRDLSGEQRVTAPMPGRVVRVLVSPGDDVTAGQGLVVVEAMKMENELRAPRAGRVREVLVQEGATVEAGQALAVVE